MALNEDTEALLLAYVYGELSASDARDFERRMDAGTPEAAELRAEVEGLRASRELFGKDAAFGLRSGVDVPPAHLVDAIMNAEKLARLPAVRDAALARVAPPVDKSFTAKLSRWLLGGGLAVGAAAAVFIVVTQGAQEPALQAESFTAEEGAASAVVVEAPPPIDAPKAEEAPPPPAEPEADAQPTPSNVPLGGAFADGVEGKGADGNSERLRNSGDVAGADVGTLDDGFARVGAAKPTDLEAERTPPAQDPAMMSAAGRGRADDAKKLAKADSADAREEAKLEQNRMQLDELSGAKTKAKESAQESAKQFAKDSARAAREPALEASKRRPEPRAGDDFSFDKKAEEKAPLRDGDKAGMRGSIGADKDTRGGGGLSGGGLGLSGGGVPTGAASGPGSAPTTTTPATPAADAPTSSRAMSPPPPAPPKPASKVAPKPNVVADAKPAPMSEADDEESVSPAPAKKVISREALEEQRKNVRKKSAGTGATGKSVGAEAERAKRLEQANIALASAQREMAAKRWLSAFDQMALAETLDLDRALGATPLLGQMRALVELKRPVDAARVARRLGRWDVKAFDVVPGLLLGAQVAEQIGDERLARELWTRLLEVPSEKAKARAALDRMEGAKALRRQRYDSDAAEAPAAAAPAEAASESKE